MSESEESVFEEQKEHLREHGLRPLRRIMLAHCAQPFGWGETEAERNLLEKASLILVVGCDVPTSRYLCVYRRLGLGV